MAKLSPSLEEKRKQLETFKSSVEQMRENIKTRREQRFRERAKEDICFWMDNAIFPFLQGIAESFNEPLLDGIKRLIKEKKNPFRPKQDWTRVNETQLALKSFLATPQTKLLQNLAKPFLKAKMDWIYKEAEWIREEVMKEAYPDIYDAIMNTEGGKEWLDDLITDITKTLKRELR